MEHIMDTLERYVAETPDDAILFDESHGKGITYA